MKLEDQMKFYNYYPKLVDMSKDKKLVKTFHLNAGDVLVANNWRLLHGRTSFTGERMLSGKYTNYCISFSKNIEQ